MYFENDINEVKFETNLMNIIKQFIPLKESRRALKGNCPFHVDTASSLMVLPEKKIFKCFGCGKEGNLTDLINLLADLNQ